MAPKHGRNNTGSKRDTKHGKNGKKDGVSGSSFFTWFMVIALLGVWTSVAVVWFDLVDYEEVLAKAKDFRYNLSEVLQGKLGDYDADGDGDFDIEDAKVLLGLKEKSVPEEGSEDIDDAVLQASDKPGIKDDLEEAFEASFREVLSEDDGDDDEHDEEPAVVEETEQVTELELEDALETDNIDVEIEEPKIIATKVQKEELQIQEQPEVAEEQEEELEPVASEEDDEVEETAATEENEEETEVVEDAVEEPEHVAVEESVGLKDAEEEPELADEPAVVEDLEEAEPAGTEAAEEPVIDKLRSEDEHYHETDIPETQEYETIEESYTTDDEPKTHEPISEDKEDDDDDYEVHHTEDEPQEAEPFASDQPGDEQPEDEETEEIVPETSDTIEEETVLASDFSVDDIEEDLYDTAHLAEQDTEKLQEVKEESATDPVEAESVVETEEVRTNEQAAEENTLLSEEEKEESAGSKDSASEEKKEKAKKKKPKLLNKFDKTIKVEIDSAEKLRKKGKVDEAVRAFESLVNKYPQSPRARYGKAQCEDDLAEKMRSNEMLQRAISTYEEVTELPNVSSDLVKLALRRRANRQQFLGRMRGSVVTLQKLVQLFPDDLSLRNELGVGFLLLGDNKSAKRVYEEVLQMAPNDGFAKVHYGFILKAENKIAESIPFLKEGLESGDPGTNDGRFYFHLGDAMQRAGDKEAYKWYEAGHKNGHFASVWQRSLYNVNGLKAQPWWTAKETGYTDLVKTLESNWKLIRDEGLAVMDKSKGLFVPEDENLREKGDWSQYTLWQQGRKNENSCKAAPRTCAMLEKFPESTGCRRGQIKYSVMHPGTHVWPHTGPTNCRLRMHLGLVIPQVGCNIRCANDTRTWEEGKVLIFDDSFEHEVWQDADSYRLIFIVDVWHPELSANQRRTLPAI